MYSLNPGAAPSDFGDTFQANYSCPPCVFLCHVVNSFRAACLTTVSLDMYSYSCTMANTMSYLCVVMFFAIFAWIAQLFSQDLY